MGIASRSTYGMPVSEIQSPDLPSSASTALEIDCSDQRVCRLNILVSTAWRMCFARTAAEAATKLAGNTSSGVFPANIFLAIDVSGSEAEKPNVYVRSTGLAAPAGVTFWQEGQD